MPSIPATETVTIPPTQAIVLDRWGVPVIAITTDTESGVIDASIVAQRGNATGWSPLPEHRCQFRSTNLVADVVALNDAQALADLQAAQTAILALVRRLMIARGLGAA